MTAQFKVILSMCESPSDSAVGRQAKPGAAPNVISTCLLSFADRNLMATWKIGTIENIEKVSKYSLENVACNFVF